MSVRLRVGMGDSYGLRPVVLASPDFNPLLVTGVTFRVTKPSGTTVSWVGTIGTKTAASVQALYAFDGAGTDLDAPGTWRFWLQWTVPGEVPGPRSEVSQFTVVAADAV